MRGGRDVSGQQRVRVSIPGMDGSRRVVEVVRSQPNWVTRWAIVAFLLIIALPVLALLLVAGVISLVVFVVLALWARLLGRHMPDWHRHDEEGRENVTVRRPGQ